MRLLPIVAVQFPISLDIGKNLETILSVISTSKENELFVFPEGALSGYDVDPAFLDNIPYQKLNEALQKLQDEVGKRRIHLIFGSCLYEDDEWYNAGLYLSHNAAPFTYRKINLATNERSYFRAGNQLPIFTINLGEFKVVAGLQLCREIRFPEQWQYLARSGAEILVYLTNAVDGDDHIASVWRSHLVSRAAENQRFVIAANNAHKQQKCPSMIVAPDGTVIDETMSSEIIMLREQINLSKISNWYLDQARTDVVKIISNTAHMVPADLRQTTNSVVQDYSRSAEPDM